MQRASHRVCCSGESGFSTLTTAPGRKPAIFSSRLIAHAIGRRAVQRQQPSGMRRASDSRKGKVKFDCIGHQKGFSIQNPRDNSLVWTRTVAGRTEFSHQTAGRSQYTPGSGGFLMLHRSKTASTRGGIPGSTKGAKIYKEEIRMGTPRVGSPDLPMGSVSLEKYVRTPTPGTLEREVPRQPTGICCTSRGR